MLVYQRVTLSDAFVQDNILHATRSAGITFAQSFVFLMEAQTVLQRKISSTFGKDASGSSVTCSDFKVNLAAAMHRVLFHPNTTEILLKKSSGHFTSAPCCEGF
jgi:hypothetical protein